MKPPEAGESQSGPSLDPGPSSPPPSSPRYKGVRKRKWGKWVSEIRLPNSRERIWLGSYDSAEKAARAFDAALFCLRGRDAKFNFPSCPPDIPGAQNLTHHKIQAVAARYANEGSGPEVVSSTEPPALQGGEEHSMDWSFLGELDENEGRVSGLGFLYSDMEYMTGDSQLQPPPAMDTNVRDGDDDPDDRDDDNDGGSGGDSYLESSFLWTF